MDTTLYIAMNGANRSLTEQHVYSNNLANVNTAGFKSDLYQAQTMYVPGKYPAQAYGVTVQGAINKENGPIIETGNNLDIAMTGGALFAVETKDGNEAYTAGGQLTIDGAGQLKTATGYPVLGNGGAIIVPPAESVQISPDGTISVVPLGESPDSVVALDRIKMVLPTNEDRLVKGNNGLILSASGNLNASAQARLVPGAYQGSNVNSIENMVNMINASREYETQIKLISEVSGNQQALARILQS